MLATITILLFMLVPQDTTTTPADTAVTLVQAAEISDSGFIGIGLEENWKYHPGDNMEWADPDFDDSGWYNLSPSSLAIDEMPDSLWSGYGWWTITFKTDSAFYEQNWNLYFWTWGGGRSLSGWQTTIHVWTVFC